MASIYPCFRESDFAPLVHIAFSLRDDGLAVYELFVGIEEGLLQFKGDKPITSDIYDIIMFALQRSSIQTAVLMGFDDCLGYTIR